MVIKVKIQYFSGNEKKYFISVLIFHSFFTFSLRQKINNLYFCNKNEPILLLILFKLSGTLCIVYM